MVIIFFSTKTGVFPQTITADYILISVVAAMRQQFCWELFVESRIWIKSST